MSWRDHAACIGMPTDLFYLPDGIRGPARQRQEQRAKAVCARCPVRLPCWSYAVSNGEAWGVWGGSSEEDRRGVRRSGLNLQLGLVRPAMDEAVTT